MDAMFETFFSRSWPSLYKLIIHILKNNEETILEKDNISDMVLPIRDFRLRSGFDRFLAAFPFLGSFFGATSWRQLVEESQAVAVSSQLHK